MFFETESFSPNILSVLDLSWGVKTSRSSSRPFHALSFRICGDSDFIYGDKSLHAESGDILFVPSNLIYTLRSNKEKVLVIHFTCDCKLPREIKKFKPQNPKYFESKFRDLFDAWSKKQTGYEYECKSILYKILLGIEREWNQKKISTASDKLFEAVEYMHESFSDPELTVDSIASKYGMSGTYFRRLFAERFSTTPLKYLNKLRFSLATELLLSNYYTVEEISERCGFNNVNYFSLFIKQRTGMPPSVYRRELLKTK